MELEEIYKPIKSDLKKSEKKLSRIIFSPDPLLEQLISHLLATKGKRIRAALILLSARLGSPKSISTDVAAAVELIHSATLIHDDVIDKARIRRKKLSIRSKFGDNLAVLFGDYIYSKIFGFIFSLNLPKVMQILLHATTKICRGEIYQLHKAFKIANKEDYMKIASQKTASFFSACCEIGAVLSELPYAKVKALKEYGYFLGITFQIVDDCLDFIGDQSKTGKTINLDYRMGRVTLPLLYMKNFPNRSKKEAINFTLKIGNNYGQKALLAIDSFPDSEIKMSFKKLVFYVLDSMN